MSTELVTYHEMTIRDETLQDDLIVLVTQEELEERKSKGWTATGITVQAKDQLEGYFELAALKNAEDGYEDLYE